MHACVIIVLAGLVFANSLHNGFHLDDYYRVVRNPGIQQLSQPWLHFIDPSTMATIERIGGYRPMLPLTLSINYAIAGDSLVGYHLGNLGLQIGAAWLVYLLVLRLLSIAPPKLIRMSHPSRSRWVALCVALLFAVHPVSGIPVNYICARDQLLSQLFWSGSLLVYLGMHQRRAFTGLGWAAALSLLTASLMSKGDAVMAPGLILCLELTVLGQSIQSWRPWRRAAMFALPVIGLFAFQSLVLDRSEVGNVVNAEASRWTYALTQARLHVFRYLPQFVWPFSIRQDPDETLASGSDLAVLISLVVIAVSLVEAYRARRTHPLVSFCIFAYWVTIAPTSSFVPLHHIAVDYRPYPASPYLFLALSLAALHLRASLHVPVAVGAIAWCAIVSFHLNRTWLNDRTLWAHSVQQGGGSLAYHNLAMATPDVGERRALLERALEISPNYVLAKINLGRALVRMGEVEAGLDWLEQAVRSRPRDGQARYWYGRTLYDIKRYPQASREADRAAELDPRNARTVHQAALAWQAVGDHQKAMRWLDALDKLRPRMLQADFARGFSLQQLGRSAEAIAAYRRLLEHSPDHVQGRFNLGYELMKSKECGQAIPEFERALALQPDRRAALLHLASCSKALGDAAAAQRYQDAWERSSDAPRATRGKPAPRSPATLTRSAE
jgi:tetratricopeptide (TPR) repeat protein